MTKETVCPFVVRFPSVFPPHGRIQGDNMRSLTLGGHVGFDSLPDQLVNKEVNKGFDFNILCVGECRINALCSRFFRLHVCLYTLVWKGCAFDN